MATPPEKRVVVLNQGTEVTTSNPFPIDAVNSVVPDDHDYIGLTYDGSDRLETITYKTGGSGGTTLLTITLTYDGASERIATVSYATP